MSFRDKVINSEINDFDLYVFVCSACSHGSFHTKTLRNGPDGSSRASVDVPLEKTKQPQGKANRRQEGIQKDGS